METAKVFTNDGAGLLASLDMFTDDFLSGITILPVRHFVERFKPHSIYS